MFKRPRNSSQGRAVLRHGDAVACFGGGLLVESHMGRPTKVEGNPSHPGSLGAADVFAQASVLTLYDPDRSQVPVHLGRVASWDAFLAAIENKLNEHRSTGGVGLRLLTETITSPTLAAQIRDFLTLYPAAKWHQYEPCAPDGPREGARLAFGEYVSTIYRFDRAEAVLALDADFLASGPGSIRYARDFADKRRVVGAHSQMNRLYAVESVLSSTGAMADHRWPMRSCEVESFARAVAEALGIEAWRGRLAHEPQGQEPVPSEVKDGQSTSFKVSVAWVQALVRDLQNHRGSSIVIAGEQQPPIVHAVAHAMNHALGNIGKTVVYTAPLEAQPVNEMQSLRDLVEDIKSGQVQTLVILGANPVFTSPADLEFAKHLLTVDLRVHLGLYEDETAELCHWHLPEAHYLESWGDTRAYDGTVSIIQPLIAPLYNGKSVYELVAVLQGRPDRSGYGTVRDYWRNHPPAGQGATSNFEALWETWLNEGIIAGTALPPQPVSLKEGLVAGAPVSDLEASDNAGLKAGATGRFLGGLEIAFRPDPSVWDGRFANNGWLQELPRPFTKLTWDNAALVSPATAQRLGLNREDVVKLTFEGRELEAPVLITPGHADDSITLHLGYGRRRAGRVGSGVGVNAYVIRPSNKPWFGLGLQIQKTGDRHHLVTTQDSHLINQNGHLLDDESEAAFKRDLVRVATLEEFRKDPNFAADPPEQTTKAASLYPPYNYKEGYQWGLSVDLNSCIGCNACIVACDAENNIPVVGSTQVDNGRDMAWIRVDTYYRGSLDNPETYNEVVMCMHCENAPCEYVCPVGATVHSPEGLNLMVYNRCVGTRYCSNNCPYKVRRFNFLLFSDWTTPSLYALRNPDVSVRSRGVMEKCTYCVQRIQEVKIKAEREDRAIQDGEILTACQQTCPTQAIVFGNINDPNSRVSKLKAQSRQYGLLRDLNTRPRTTYLARLRNPNPEIKVS
jgi:molybdopterin-containing oxidoreductase family iron-sulfur binding subunit